MRKCFQFQPPKLVEKLEREFVAIFTRRFFKTAGIAEIFECLEVDRFVLCNYAALTERNDDTLDDRGYRATLSRRAE